MSVGNQVPRVTVVGGGISGLTAALRLVERGFEVQLLEKRHELGGAISSRRFNGVYHDVFGHMFCDWYQNFWRIVERDLGYVRSDHFEPKFTIKALAKGADHFQEMTTGTWPKGALINLTSGVQPMPDMAIYSYSMLDLACQEFQNNLLSRYTVNGFLHSRPYMTERAAALQDDLILQVWSVHSDDTSAESFRDFVRLGVKLDHREPFMWLLKGSLATKLIRPLAEKIGLERIRTDCAVESLSVEEEGVRLGCRIEHASELTYETSDYVILALPPKPLASLVRSGKEGQRIVDRVPGLSELERLRGEQLPVVDLYFKRKLDDIPSEEVGLTGSSYALSFLDLSQLWDDEELGVDGSEATVLTLACSDVHSVPEDPEDEEGKFGFAMISQLHEYLPRFNPGKFWRDPESDIDWDKTAFQPNHVHKLFINEVGSDQWRPQTCHPELPRVFFAADVTRSFVEMATVEAAVVTGLEAASALWRQEPLGERIEILRSYDHSESTLLALKLLLAPVAYGSKLWSSAIDLGRLQPEDSETRETELTSLVDDAVDLFSDSLSFAADWWGTAATFWARALLPRDRSSRS